jgi:hypothetical protein
VLATPVQQVRRIPDSLIIGAPKSGTTSLANALPRHRELYIPTIKELSFFDSNTVMLRDDLRRPTLWEV